MRTKAPNIWAAGDVTGSMALESLAAREGHVAASNALEGSKKSIDYDTVPHAVFTNPQVASVGLTEAKLMRREGVCACRTVPMSAVPKALAVEDFRGLLKMVVNPKTGRIVGVHAVSPVAAEIVTAGAYALRAGWTLDDVIETVHIFPTMAEALKLAAQAFRRDITKMSCCVE
jgi:mercuric reductase